MKVSKLAENIIGSEIIKLASEVNEKIKQGEKIYNLTIGDFNPEVFPIPDELKKHIIEQYQANQTNYPPADGVLELRDAVSNLLSKRCDLNYTSSEILIAGGARPIIYSIFRTLVDKDDTVIFAVPSWNNNHYSYLNGAKAVVIEAKAENNFMPTAEDIAPFIKEASLIALCSPQNPTGTVFTKEGLTKICDLIVAENKRRGEDVKPVYLMYDQIYWELTYNHIKHYNPVSLRPDMKPYTVFVDGISKSLAATGVRVGWSMGPAFIINKMKAVLTHIGAWAPKAEQIASAKYLMNLTSYASFIESQKHQIKNLLNGFYEGFMKLKEEGFQVDAIAPQAAIYLTINFSLKGKKTKEGQLLHTTKEITKYILDEAKMAVVPFYAFGAPENSSWYRLSVGTCRQEDVSEAIEKLRAALQKLS